MDSLLEPRRNSEPFLTSADFWNCEIMHLCFLITEFVVTCSSSHRGLTKRGWMPSPDSRLQGADRMGSEKADIIV